MEEWTAPIARIAYLLLAAFAGAVTALAFMKWKDMTKVEVILTLFVGASFAIFVTPWVATIAFGKDGVDPQTLAGLTYVMASGSNALIPLFIRRIKSLTGLDEPTQENRP